MAPFDTWHYASWDNKKYVSTILAKNVQSESDHEKKIQSEMWQVHSIDKVAWTLKKKSVS